MLGLLKELFLDISPLIVESETNLIQGMEWEGEANVVHRIVIAQAVLCFFLMMTNSVLAAGFALFEHGVKELGTASSAPAATAQDPSTVFFNPAGMTLLEGNQAQAAIHVIIPQVEFDGQGSNVFGASLGSHEGGNAGVTKVAPNAYYTYNSGRDWAVGIGVNVPFGLATSYDRSWIGRYHNVDSDVLTVNINPAFAYRLNDRISLGAGVSAQYIDALLSRMIDFGLAALGPVGSQSADVYSEMTGDDVSFGYNLGLLLQVDPHSRVGLSYRSGIKQEIEGKVTFDFSAVSAPLLPVAAATFPSQGAKSTIDLPANAELSLYHSVNERWALLADLQWTEWSSFDRLVISFDGDLPDSVVHENWKDSWRYAVGAIFRANAQWSLRGGVCFDETPIPDPEHRSPSIPGEDRTWVAFGAGYGSGDWSFDVGYVHVFVDRARINKSVGEPENIDRGNLVGAFDFSADIASLQATYRF